MDMDKPQGLSDRLPMTQEEVKAFRAGIEQHIQKLKVATGSRELSLAITKLEEGKMWLGKHLGNIGGEDLNAKRDAQEVGTAIQGN
jgi:hypothetical protein